MRRIYTYKEKEYYSAHQVRQAIWKEEHKVFTKEPDENKAEFWNELGVTYTEEETPFETIKSQKLSELESAFSRWYQDGATLESSLGFTIDADQKAMLDVNGLVTLGQTATFMDAKNYPHTLNLEQLQTLQQEIILAGGQYYQQKWTKRAAIEAATTQEELDAIEIKFDVVSFKGEE